jgi:hypothetical protein
MDQILKYYTKKKKKKTKITEIESSHLLWQFEKKSQEELILIFIGWKVELQTKSFQIEKA